MILSFVVKIPYSGLHLKYDTPLTVPFSLPNVKYNESNDIYANKLSLFTISAYINVNILPLKFVYNLEASMDVILQHRRVTC